MFFDRKPRRSFIFDDWGFTRGTQMRGPYITRGSIKRTLYAS
jgi:hypothetical protein